MLTKVTIRNFKRFDDVEVELSNPVVFIGPNNSGKTSTLQALALWDVGVKRWSEKRAGKKTPEKRPGVTINRRDLMAIPVPNANLLWRNLRVRDIQKVKGKLQTKNVFIDIIVEGVSNNRKWECGLEFYYANEESFYCRPLRESTLLNPQRMPVPEEVSQIQLAFLPPMSGLAADELRVDPGAINVLIGEGRTAEVLRNLCWRIHNEKRDKWENLQSHIKELFGSELDDPRYVPERGEILMSYKERDIHLDLSSSGRGLQQTLLLLAYLYTNRGAVLMLDEPDAHLEILRQRQIYQLLVEVAREEGNQIIAASHSEVLLKEAADRDVVVAFLGSRPRRINDRGTQAVKALKEIGFDQYYQAEQTGWVLYLEGSTDLSILREFARTLGHRQALEVLERPFVHYVGDQPAEVSRHFFGLRAARPDLVGIALFDRLDRGCPDNIGASCYTWEKREIENYLCQREVLLKYAAGSAEEMGFGPLFTHQLTEQRKAFMEDAISEMEVALKTQRKGSPWDDDAKVSDDFLAPLFQNYFEKLDVPNLMEKKNFHVLARLLERQQIDEEVTEKLNAIVEVAAQAKTTDDQ